MAFLQDFRMMMLVVLLALPLLLLLCGSRGARQSGAAHVMD